MTSVTEETEPVEDIAAEAEIPAEVSAAVESLETDTPSGTGAASWAGFESDSADPGRRSVPTWPFFVYIFVWLVLAGVAVWQFAQVPLGEAVYNSTLYPISLLVGTGMVAFGPVLILLVWIVSAALSRSGNWGSKFLSALVKGAAATFLGAALWYLALILVDVIRLGRPF